MTEGHLPCFHLKVYGEKATVLNMRYEMNDNKLAGFANLKNFAESNVGIAIAAFSYL